MLKTDLIANTAFNQTRITAYRCLAAKFDEKKVPILKEGAAFFGIYSSIVSFWHTCGVSGDILHLLREWLLSQFQRVIRSYQKAVKVLILSYLGSKGKI